MIRPPGFSRAYFGTAADGDARSDPESRLRFERAGAPSRWAFVSQVHGRRVIHAGDAGVLGDGDALYTTSPGLSLAIGTADCVPLILEGPGFSAVVHAGWRGAAEGVVTETLRTLDEAGLRPERAAIGPAIGPCCYEVGPDVRRRFPDHGATTTWGTPSIDLPGAVADQVAHGLQDTPLWVSDRCTRTDPDLHSHRQDGTPHRQVTVAWSASG